MDEELYVKDLDTLMLMGLNGKVGGGGMIFNPFATINDGLMDMTFIPNK